MIYVLLTTGLALLFVVPCLIAEYWSEIKKKFSRRNDIVVSKNQQTIKGEKSMDVALENLVNAYLQDFERKKDLRVVMPNSIPIVWFGDMEAYRKSSVKIVTIGLNPSNKEFDCDKPRFNTRANTADALNKTLCNYFYNYPFKVYFAQFEKCLERINTSYGGLMSVARYGNTAIHIDAYSAIATDPTWSKLSQREKDSVNQQELCSRLLEYLQPDVVLMSTAHDVFYDTLHITCRPYLHYDYKGKRVIEIYKEHGQILVWGQIFGGAFGGIPNEILDEAFESISQEVKIRI